MSIQDNTHNTTTRARSLDRLERHRRRCYNSKSIGGANDQEDLCVVCLEDMKQNDGSQNRVGVCGHAFHSECVLEYQNTRNLERMQAMQRAIQALTDGRAVALMAITATTTMNPSFMDPFHIDDDDKKYVILKRPYEACFIHKAIGYISHLQDKNTFLGPPCPVCRRPHIFAHDFAGCLAVQKFKMHYKNETIIDPEEFDEHFNMDVCTNILKDSALSPNIELDSIDDDIRKAFLFAGLVTYKGAVLITSASYVFGPDSESDNMLGNTPVDVDDRIL